MAIPEERVPENVFVETNVGKDEENLPNPVDLKGMSYEEIDEEYDDFLSKTDKSEEGIGNDGIYETSNGHYVLVRGNKVVDYKLNR